MQLTKRLIAAQSFRHWDRHILASLTIGVGVAPFQVLNVCSTPTLSAAAGGFMSFSGSIQTRITPDLFTTSWISLPFLPMTFPKNTNICHSLQGLKKTDWLLNREKSFLPTKFRGTSMTSSVNSRTLLANRTASWF